MKIKKLAIICIALVTLNSIAQNKKELEQKIITLEEENTTLKLNLSNTINSFTQMMSKNNELEKTSKEQLDLIEKLKSQKDSLILISKNINNAKFVLNPSNEKDSIINVVQSFYRSENWEDRLNYVLNPEDVKSYMKSAYSDNYKVSEISKEKIIVNNTNIALNKIFKIYIYDKTIYLKKTNTGFKIDWLATNGHNVKALNVFKANKDTKPTEFRVIASISDSYPYEYQKDFSKDYLSILLNDIDYTSAVYGIISRTDENAKKLYKLLQDGKEHQIIISIYYDSSKNYSNYYVAIDKMVNESWSKE
uniref:hypothetical protein n=1 Tax=Flavobacterium sp. TaxID=239 RepID=UPI00404B1833